MLMIPNISRFQKKKSDRIKRFSLCKLLPGLFFLVLLTGYSCKTCNCPAYSYGNQGKQKHETTTGPEAKVNKNLPDDITASIFSDSL